MCRPDQRIAELEAENENLRTVMIAAAEEIKLHWEAHCDPVEGLGPVNLLRRLECGIPAEYGYKAGSFQRLKARIAELEEALSQVKQWDVAQATEAFMKGGKPMQFQLPRAVREQIQALLQEES